KTRKDVKGGGIKPWRQKGTGRARVGSIRVPHWRGGGVVFGPHQRDYSFSIPKKVMRAALKSALRDKLKTNSIIILDELKLAHPKTKELVSIFQKLKLKEKKVIFLLDSKDETFFRAAGNIKRTGCKEINSVNTFDLLYYEWIVFTKKAFTSLEKRLS
ncbi:MAG: 50S ribosomal protein L4, partial [Candidatus Ratteibacteria bacterium]|nr:50S ribosomal protein L4 [Candidatus Ratteibacteria bacterium]